jgi:FkbM family methyltransferase
LKKLIQSIFGMLGYRIIRIDRTPRSAHAAGLEPFFSVLKGAGFAPKHILDVGANRGIWTREAIKYFPAAQYTLVEPQDYLKTNVEDLVKRGYKIRWINAGAGDEAGNLAFNVTPRDDSGSFVRPPEDGQARTRNEIIVQVRTLDEIVRSSSAPVPEMVKIDAEGFDLKVLAGASELFGKTDIFLVEAMVREGGGFENTISKVIGKMARVGYGPIDITDLNRSPKHGIVWLCELAFLRNGSGLLDGVSSYE